MKINFCDKNSSLWWECIIRIKTHYVIKIHQFDDDSSQWSKILHCDESHHYDENSSLW